MIAPNYQAGRDALAGFKSAFKGEIADEVYVPLNQLDYAAELSRIAAAKPDANQRGEEREARHSHDVEGVDDGLAGNDLFRAIGSGVAVRRGVVAVGT